MKTRRIQGPDIQTALREVRRVLGVDAVIMTTRETEEGIEIVAAAPARLKAGPSAELRAARVAAKAAVGRSVDDGARAARPQPIAKVAASIAGAAYQQVAREALAAQKANDAKTAQAEKTASAEKTSPRAPVAAPKVPAPVASAVDAGEAQTVAAAPSPAPARRRPLSPLASMAAGMARPNASTLAAEAAARAALAARIDALGLAGDVRRRIADAAESALASGSPAASPGADRDPLVAALTASIAVEGKALIANGGRVAVLGGTGVGKTTTIAKLAAHFARRHGPGQVALVNADQYRIGASDQLRRFGRLIGVPTFEVHGRDELDATLARLADRRLVLVDTAGIAAHDVRFAEQVNLLDGAGLDLYLALSLNTQTAVLARCVQSFSSLPIRACVLTKEDEATSLGGGLSMALRHALPLAYVTNGPHVPADIRLANAGRIAARAVELADAAGEEPGAPLEVVR